MIHAQNLRNPGVSEIVGADIEGTGDRTEQHEGVFGLGYLLPLNIRSRTWVDTAGGIQVAAGKRLEITPRLTVFSEAEYDSKDHWEIRAGYKLRGGHTFFPDWQWHSQFGWGAGLRWQF